jgi:hypothetical protein
VVAYGERLLAVPVYELYNPGQRLLLALLESVFGSDGGIRMNIGLCQCKHVEWILYPGCPMKCTDCGADIEEVE